VDARAGHLSDGAQVAEAGAAVAVDRDAAARVVGGGDDGDGPGRQVEAEVEAAGDELGEPAADPRGGLVGNVEQHVRLVLLEQALVDRARDDVAGSELAVGMEILQERCWKLRCRAFAAQRSVSRSRSFGCTSAVGWN
jgi:hypothetical protein